MSFLTDRSDLNGSSERQNAMSRHWRGSSESRNRWHSFSTMFSACFSYRGRQRQNGAGRRVRRHAPSR